MSRKRPEIKLKGEALFPHLGKEEIDFAFEPRRDGEDDFGSGLTFNVVVGPKVAIVIVGVFANLVVSILNFLLRTFI